MVDFYHHGKGRVDNVTYAKRVASLGSTFIPGSLVGKGAKFASKGYGMYRGSKAYQVLRTVKRPVTSTITRLGYSSKPEQLAVGYGYTKALVGLMDPLSTTRHLIKGEYGAAVVSYFGPPFADKAYLKFIDQSLASSSSPSQQNGGAKGKLKALKNIKGKRYSLPRYDMAGIFSKSGRVLHNPCSKGYVPKMIKGLPYCVKK